MDDEEDTTPVVVPMSALPPDTLRALVEEFVTRDGTDYGDRETPLQAKVEQVRQLLDRERAFILFDEETASCTILPAEQLPDALR